jgi:endonuclease-3 related protein
MLDDAAKLLREHYGTATDAWPQFQWPSLVWLVCSAGITARKAPVDWSWIDQGPLHSAHAAVAAGAPRIAEELKAHGQVTRPAGSLLALAVWWLQDARRDSESPQAWERPIELLREELCALPGVSLTLADRILLFVGGLRVFPIDRAALRIVGRHGWVEQSADYDEWQSFLTRGTTESNYQLADLARWFSAIGGNYCRARPDCQPCPLRGFLPCSGPLSLTGDEPAA